MANEPLTPEMEKDIRDWLALQDSLYAEGGVWHGRKQEAHHIRLAAAVAEIDRLRQRVTNLEDIETDDQAEIDRLREELSIVEQENKEVRQGAERECDRLRANARPCFCCRQECNETGCLCEPARTALEGKP